MKTTRINSRFLLNLADETLENHANEDYFIPATALQRFELNSVQYHALKNFVSVCHRNLRNEYRANKVFCEKVRPYIPNSANAIAASTVALGVFTYFQTQDFIFSAIFSLFGGGIMSGYERKNRFFAAMYAGVAPRREGQLVPRGFSFTSLAAEVLTEVRGCREIEIVEEN